MSNNKVINFLLGASQLLQHPQCLNIRVPTNVIIETIHSHALANNSHLSEGWLHSSCISVILTQMKFDSLLNYKNVSLKFSTWYFCQATLLGLSSLLKANAEISYQHQCQAYFASVLVCYCFLECPKPSCTMLDTIQKPLVGILLELSKFVNVIKFH